MPGLLTRHDSMSKPLLQTPLSYCLVVLTIFSVLTACDAADKTKQASRKPTVRELLAYNVARAQQLPELCTVIDPAAHMKAAWSPAGTQISALRSRCYYSLAIETTDSSICADVTSVKHSSLDGSAFSEKACRGTIASNASGNTTGNTSAIYIPPDQLRMELEKLGYTHSSLPEKIRTATGTEQGEAFLVYFLQTLQTSPTFATQLLQSAANPNRP
jgi:hypothetical protein